jgi:hypothetical protein
MPGLMARRVVMSRREANAPFALWRNASGFNAAKALPT